MLPGIIRSPRAYLCWNKLFKIENLLGVLVLGPLELLFSFFLILFVYAFLKQDGVSHVYYNKAIIKEPHLFQSQCETLRRLLV